MAKKPSSTSDGISVKLKCVYSGHPDNPQPGDVIKVDAAEADRLVALGAAERVDEI